MSRPRSPSLWLHRLGIRRLPAEESVTWEIDHHLQELVDRLLSEGWTKEDALAEAERRFGDRRRYGSRMARMERTGVAVDHVAKILTFLRQSIGGALRTARRNPGFAAGVILTLALGIGANATMYGIIDRLLLSPPKYIERPKQVRRVIVERPSGLPGGDPFQGVLTYPDYEDLRGHPGISVAAYEYPNEYTIGRGENASRVRTTLASAELLPLLGVQPLLGRFFTTDEAAQGASPLTVLVSEEYWRRVYGGDPEVLGRTIEIGDDLATIVGVLPAGFTGVELEAVDLWLPLEAMYARRGGGDCMQSRGCYWAWVVARLNDGVSVAQAEAEATRLHLNGRRDQVAAGRYSEAAKVLLTPLVAAEGPSPSSESQVARWLMAVGMIVFLIACANVANILLARGTERSRETAVRLALGVGRRRLIAQSTLEAIVLALAGGMVALAIARWGGALIRDVLLPGIYFPDSAVSARVLAFTAVSAVLAGLLAGLWPAVQGSRLDLASHFGDQARFRGGLRGALNVGQGAMSVVLLVAAGLFIRSLTELRAKDLGIDTDQLLTVDFDLAVDDAEGLTRTAAFDEATRRVAVLPSVRSVAATGSPMSSSIAIPLHISELDSLPRLPGGGPYIVAVGPRYFETTGLELASGRGILETDGPSAPKVTVVPETTARLLWPGQDALGKCMLVGREPSECTTVVGVARDAVRNGYLDPQSLSYYVPLAQAPDDFEFLRAPNALYVRARDDVSETQAAVADALRGFSPSVRWVFVRPLGDLLDRQARSWTLGATMFTAFGVLALVLAAIGLYGILAFDVARRTRELGVRTALGARRSRLLASVIRRGLAMGAAGVALGTGVAYFAAPHIQDLLYQVSPHDPFVLGVVAATLLAVSLAASLIPGVRATRVDPMTALKSD